MKNYSFSNSVILSVFAYIFALWQKWTWSWKELRRPQQLWKQTSSKLTGSCLPSTAGLKFKKYFTKSGGRIHRKINGPYTEQKNVRKLTIFRENKFLPIKLERVPPGQHPRITIEIILISFILNAKAKPQHINGIMPKYYLNMYYDSWIMSHTKLYYCCYCSPNRSHCVFHDFLWLHCYPIMAKFY